MDVCVRQIYVSPSVGSKINTRTRAQASMNSILLRWAPSLNIRSKLKGPCKHKINRSNTFLIPGLSFHSLSLKNLSPDTVPLKERGQILFFKSLTFRERERELISNHFFHFKMCKLHREVQLCAYNMQTISNKCLLPFVFLISIFHCLH